MNENTENQKENTPLEPNRVIIVDDDEDLCEMLTFSFDSNGYDVTTFQKGEDAKKFLFDPKNLEDVVLIILDRVLPDAEGVELLREVKAKIKKIPPVLILSTVSTERDIITGLKSGATEYITKPFSLSILMEKARLLIERSKS